MNNKIIRILCFLLLISWTAPVLLVADSTIDFEEQIFGKKRRAAEKKAREAAAARKKAINELKETRKHLENIHQQNQLLDRRNDSLRLIRTVLNNSLYE